MIDQLAYFTPDLPGIGGVIKQRPEDFLVEELPLYPPVGRGEHLFVFVEKRLRSTSDVIRHLARAFRVGKGDIGYAGLKDKLAITRQQFSVRLPDPGQDQQRLERVNNRHVRLVWAIRHENKLRRGHLAGNRFSVRVRGANAGGVSQADRILERLVTGGVPNYVGQQRFGYRWANHRIGRLLLLGQWQPMLDLMLGHPMESDHAPTRAARQAYERRDYQASLALLPRHLHSDRQAIDVLRQGKSAEEAVMAIDRHQRAFLISATQSAIFNRVLDRRFRDPDSPGMDRLISGDLAWKHENRSVFGVDQAVADRENGPAGRVRTLAVSPSGPMWGQNMCRAQGVVGRWESQALHEEQLDESDLRGGPQGSADGSRRPLRVVVRDAEVSDGVDEHGSYIQLGFRLPRGSFATVVLREIMKSWPLEHRVGANASRSRPVDR